MIVQKDSTAVYLGWKEHSGAKLLVRLLTSTFPRNYLDFLLVSLVRDKIELTVCTTSRIIGFVYHIKLEPVFMAFQLLNILDYCKTNTLEERLFLQGLYRDLRAII
jgi:hypothetical protein